MSRYRLDIWDEAEDELFDAVEWYNAEREGLGDQLLVELEQTLGYVSSTPLQYPIVDGELRRAMIPRFPYSVIYRLRNDVIEIIAVMHQSRRPDRWKQRRR